MRTDRFKQIQPYTAIVVLTIVLIGSVLARAITIAPTDGNLLKEIDAPHPVYPKRAWEKSPEGEVTLMFDVTKDGYVENPCIVDSSLPGKFELYALQALKDYRYEQIGGPSQRMTGVKKRFTFTLDSNPTESVRVKYPQLALEQAAEGYVVVRFGVSEAGAVQDVEVVSAEPSGFFEAAARDATGEMKFEPTRFDPDDKILHKFIFSLNSSPRRAVSAVYPAEAWDQLLHGHVIVEFDINAAGKVENPVSIYSDVSVFETAAIAAVSQFNFVPGKPEKGVLHKIEFSLDQDYQPLSKEPPEYPEQAWLDNIEGYVILQFDITKTGAVENPEVVEASPPNVFDKSAIKAAKKFTYSPRYVAGKPTRTERVKNRIVYTIPGEEDNKPERALYDNSPEAKQKLPVIMPRINMKQFLEDIKGDSPEERMKKLDDLISQGTVVRESRPTHRFSIKGNQEDGSIIVEFDVNEKGVVEQPNIVEVRGTVLSQDVTQRILEDVGYFRYEPLVIDDTPLRTDDVRHRIELRFQEN